MWLRNRGTTGTNYPKTAWERVPYYTRTFSRKQVLIRGEKPKALANIAKITEKQWERYQNGLNRDNPILTGLRYLKTFQDESVRTYAQAAEILGVSRERVYQLTSLVTKLPAEIKDHLVGTTNPVLLTYFTERRLRPLSMLPDDQAKIARFKVMLEEVGNGSQA